MKVLQVTDKAGTAIDILAHFIRKHNPHDEIEVMPFHPKRPDKESVDFLRDHWKDYDLIHWQYWKSWKKAQELIPEIDQAKSILSHYNPYDLQQDDWLKYHQEVCVFNEEQRNQLGYGTLIRMATDESLWRWEANDLTTIGMCANRIEGKKGVKEVAEVAKEMGLKLIIMGRISKPAYWQEVLNVGADIEFHESVPFEKMSDIYHKMGVFICNSVDNFESGPMPVFEALLNGIPVASRPVGQVRELLRDRDSFVQFNDKEEMKLAIAYAFENREELRDKGWNVAKRLTSLRYAREYGKLYNKVIFGGYPLVSVIVPLTEKNADRFPAIKESVLNQSYKNVEVIPVVDNEDGYNLAKSRNKGIIKSKGKYLLFLDDRFVLEEGAIQAFINQHNDRYNTFLFGNKGSHKKQFVENFSFTRRQDLIDAGMFNERIDKYGGMSQEIRTRLNRQGWQFKFCEEAFAKELYTSKNRASKRSDTIAMKDLLYQLGL